jgi:hypothetical protein
MSFKRLSPLFAVLLFSSAIHAQESSSPATPLRDPQAIGVLTRALTAAGGTQAIAAIEDFTATGNVTYFWSEENVSGSVQIRGRGLQQFRVDATLQDDVHSWIVSDGKAFEKNPDGSTSPWPSQNAIKYAGATFPLPYLVSVLQNSTISVTYGGLVTHDGAQVYDIVVQETLSQSVDPLNAIGKITKAHFFIDPNSLLIESVEDAAFRKDGGPDEARHEMQFSNYKTQNGLLVPLAITELVAGQKTASIQLNQMTFNTGLNDGDFE